MGLSSHNIVDFSQVDKVDLELVGKKAQEFGKLKQLGIPIPDGFVITTSFFTEFLETTGIYKDIEIIKKISHPSLKDSMPKLFEPVKKKITHTRFPQELSFELHKFYRKLSGLFKESSLNIFTSPLKGKSLRFSDIKGDANLVLKIKTIWIQQIENPTPIIVQKNIKSKIIGKIITNDPMIDKKFIAIAKKIQNYFYFPQEIEYAIEKDKIYLTQIKPFTGVVQGLTKKDTQEKISRKILIKGLSVNPGIVTGPVKVLRKNHDRIQIKSGEIIVLSHLSVSSYGKIKKAKGIIIDADLSSSYDRMLYRKDIKIPTIIGTKNAVKILQNGNIVTVNGMSGEIYSGGLI